MSSGTELKREDILKYLRSRRSHLRQVYRVRRIAVIGSFARNEHHEESDVDLLVDIEPGTPGLFDLKRALRAELETEFGRPVDLASERYLKPYYREQILREAVYA